MRTNKILVAKALAAKALAATTASFLTLGAVACSDDDKESPATTGPQSTTKGDPGPSGPMGAPGAAGPKGDPGASGFAYSCPVAGAAPAVSGTDPLSSLVAIHFRGAPDLASADNVPKYVKARVDQLYKGTMPALEFPLSNQSTDTVRQVPGLCNNVVVSWLDPLTCMGVLIGRLPREIDRL